MPTLTEKLLSGRATDQHPVRTFIEAKSSIERTLQHFKRTTNRLMRRYMGCASSVLESYVKRPTDSGGEVLRTLADDCAGLFEASQSGNSRLFYAILPEALNRASESTSLMESFAPSGLGTSGTRIEECKYESEHESFARKLDKKFRVNHSRLELLNEGLYIYFDRDDTATLLGVPPFDITSFSFAEDYILLRRGSVDDFSFGSFGEELSKWGFVYSPSEGTQVED